jgi:RNA dependent RNA polymerase
MVKFVTRYEMLEVCSVGKHVPYYLNRNVILLLSAHGVPNSTFLGVQRDMIRDLDEMLVSRVKAIQLLPRLSGPDSDQRSMLLHMFHRGFSPTYDPFLLDCLYSIRGHHLFNLRKKARIFIEKGGVLMGGIDETGLVPEGAVFCQLRTQAVDDSSVVNASYEPLIGPVMVTKHPVMHPGDIRMLMAIDVPELRTNRNMILFSRHGKRPEADKMSGSDLDGDEFAVCWDERLFLGEWNCCQQTGAGTFVSRRGTSISTSDVPHAIAQLALSNQTAMDFSDTGASFAVQPPLPSCDNDISEALVKHFLGHIKLASVVRCMLWLDYAAEHGAKCPECIELAKLHSIAVDYPKSGRPAEIPLHLRLTHTTPRAHWREKKGTPSYHCKSIVGQLYDEVILADDDIPVQSETALAGRRRDRHGTINCFASNVDVYLHQIYKPSIAQQLGLSTRHESTIFLNSLQRFANVERKEYEGKMLQLLNKYSIRGEGELCTGCIRKFHKLYKKRQNEFSQDMKRQYRELRKRFRSEFFRKVARLVEKEMRRESTNATDPVERLAGKVGDLSMGANKMEETETTFSAEDSEEEGFDEGDAADDDEDVEADDEEDPDANDDSEELQKVEEIVTGNFAGTARSQRDSLLCRRSRQLAAAYYDAAYSPEFRWNSSGRGTSLTLFSFPWIVADVIAQGNSLPGA